MWDTLVWQTQASCRQAGGSGDGAPGLSRVQGASSCCCALERQVQWGVSSAEPVGGHPGRLAVQGSEGQGRCGVVSAPGAPCFWGTPPCWLQVCFGSCPSPLGLLRLLGDPGPSERCAAVGPARGMLGQLVGVWKRRSTRNPGSMGLRPSWGVCWGRRPSPWDQG